MRRRPRKLSSPSEAELRCLELTRRAAEIAEELESILATGDDDDARQAVASLIAVADTFCSRIHHLHTCSLSRDAGSTATRVLARTRRLLESYASSRVTYPVLARSGTSGPELPQWASQLQLMPEPLMPSSTTKPGREEIKRYLARFLRTLQDPVDQFNVLDDDEVEARHAISIARANGRAVFHRTVKHQFVEWMRRHYASEVEDATTQIGAEVALKMSNSRKLKGAWAAFGEIVKDNMRIVRVQR